jgi:hypothetical protein
VLLAADGFAAAGRRARAREVLEDALQRGDLADRPAVEKRLQALGGE